MILVQLQYILLFQSDICSQDLTSPSTVRSTLCMPPVLHPVAAPLRPLRLSPRHPRSRGPNQMLRSDDHHTRQHPSRPQSCTRNAPASHLQLKVLLNPANTRHARRYMARTVNRTQTALTDAAADAARRRHHRRPAEIRRRRFLAMLLRALMALILCARTRTPVESARARWVSKYAARDFIVRSLVEMFDGRTLEISKSARWCVAKVVPT